MGNKILVVEDDKDIREAISVLLQGEHFEVVTASNGQKGLEVLDNSFDLVILDIMMPGMDGFETCKKIREVNTVPIIFLTAKSAEADKLKGLMVGGDDYLVKPFSYNELIARVNAQIRRYSVYKGRADNPSMDMNVMRFGDIEINRKTDQVFVKDKPILLSRLEFSVLSYLVDNYNTSLSTKQIYEAVWKEEFMYASNSTVTVYMRKLRTKIEEDPDNPKHILTVWGKGYRFV